MSKDLLFGFTGRINRAKFWLVHLAALVVIGVLMGIIAAASGLGADGKGPGAVAVIVFAVVYIALLWVSLALSVKRCHDRNRSGWFVLLSLVPFANIWYLIEVGFLPGTSGANQYGADPLASD